MDIPSAGLWTADGVREEYLTMCRAVTNRDEWWAENTILQFARDFRGRVIPLEWPPMHAFAVGDATSDNLDRSQLLRFGHVFQRYLWTVYVGRIRSCFIYDDGPVGHVYILIASSMRVYGLCPKLRRTYALADNPEAFLKLGGRRLDAYYHVPLTYSGYEINMFDHYPTEGLAWLLQEPNIDEVLCVLDKMQNGMVFEDSRGHERIVLHAPDRMGLQEVIPERVLESAVNDGFVPIGRTNVFQRFIFLGRRFEGVYVLLRDGWMFKIADTLAGAVRMRGLALSWGTGYCYHDRVAYPRYTPIGYHVPFHCDVQYTLPGDDELEAVWGPRESMVWEQ